MRQAVQNIQKIFANLREQNPFGLLWVMVLAAYVVFYPQAAWAEGDSDSLGLLMCNVVSRALTDFMPLISAISYCAGPIFAIKGVTMLRKHADNPGQNPMAPGIFHVLGGGALAGFPATIGALQDTLHIGNTAGPKFSCTPGSLGEASSLDVMMQNFVGNIYGPATILISAIAMVAGGIFIFRGLVAASKTGGADPRAAAPTMVLANLIGGAILMSIGSMLPTFMETLFGAGTVLKISSSSSIINWSKVTSSTEGTEAADKTVAAILRFIQVIGAIAFLRGWLILKKAVEGGQATIPQGITHLIGGAMAINIWLMLKIMDATFGSGLVK